MTRPGAQPRLSRPHAPQDALPSCPGTHLTRCLPHDFPPSRHGSRPRDDRQPRSRPRRAGRAVTGAGDSVIAEWARPPASSCSIAAIRPPTDPARHAAGLAAAAVLRRAAEREVRLPPRGIALTCPQGTAALRRTGRKRGVAPWPARWRPTRCSARRSSGTTCWLRACAAEEHVAGRHLDNIAPSLLGGICLIRSLDPIDVVALPVPPRAARGARASRPAPADVRRARRASRRRSSAHRDRADGARSPPWWPALYTGDLALLGRAMDDRIAEPARRTCSRASTRRRTRRSRPGRSARRSRGPAPRPSRCATATSGRSGWRRHARGVRARGRARAGARRADRRARRAGRRRARARTLGVASAPVLRCARCAHELPDDSPASTCPACDGLLEVVASRTPATRGARPRRDVHAPAGRGAGQRRLALSRDRAPAARPRRSRGPRGTRRWSSARRIARYAGCDGLLLKHEGINPTGTFKDRGMTVAVTQAARLGARAVACASTGNTSASLAAYAALAGIPALVFVPAGQVAMGKLDADARLRRAHAARARRLRRLPRARARVRRAPRASTSSIRSTRGGSRGRRRSSSSCCSSSTGMRRTGSRCRPATSAIRRRSGRRSARRIAWG